jgi:hypothetical protein
MPWSHKSLSEDILLPDPVTVNGLGFAPKQASKNYSHAFGIMSLSREDEQGDGSWLTARFTGVSVARAGRERTTPSIGITAASTSS